MKNLKTKLTIGISMVVLIAGLSFALFHFTNIGASSSPYDNFPQKKKEMLEKEDQEANIAKSRNVKKEDTGPEIIQKDTDVKTEILEHVDHPLSKKVINFTNGWVSDTNGTMKAKIVGVGVGSLTKDLQQGVILVDEFNEKRGLISSEQVLTPEKVGPVKIVSYKGMVLTLKSDDGHEFLFNVASKKFIENKK